jgi:hypothetical protein
MSMGVVCDLLGETWTLSNLFELYCPDAAVDFGYN